MRIVQNMKLQSRSRSLGEAQTQHDRSKIRSGSHIQNCLTRQSGRRPSLVLHNFPAEPHETSAIHFQTAKTEVFRADSQLVHRLTRLQPRTEPLLQGCVCHFGVVDKHHYHLDFNLTGDPPPPWPTCFSQYLFRSALELDYLLPLSH